MTGQPPPWPIPNHPSCRWCGTPIQLAYVADRFNWVHVKGGYPCPDRHFRPVPTMAEPFTTGSPAAEAPPGGPAIDAGWPEGLAAAR